MPTKTESQLGSYQITTIMTGEPWRENCYVIRQLTSGDQVVIDPGDAADTIIQAVLTGGGNLRYILLTHTHHDHVGVAAAISRQFNLPCYLHQADVRLLHHAPMYALRFANRQIEPLKSFQAHTEWSLLQFGNSHIKVIHTPGHTPGSVCYQFENFICTGDTLLYQRVGRTDLPGANITQLTNSVVRLIESLPGDTAILPGHGRTWTAGMAKTWWQQVPSSPPQYDQFGA